MRCARVQQKCFPHVPPPLACFDELDGRKAHPLLIDARRIAGFAAGNPTADIGMMRHRCREADHPTVEENRCTDGAVVEVRDAGDVGIIGEEHVTRAQRLERESLQDRRHENQRRTEMRRRIRRERDGASCQVANRRRAISAFLDVRRIGGADETRAHFRSRRFESAGDDLGQADAQRHRRVRRRLPTGSAAA